MYPHRIAVRGASRPKEFAHAELVTEWVQKLRPKASEAHLLGARAHASAQPCQRMKHYRSGLENSAIGRF